MFHITEILNQDPPNVPNCFYDRGRDFYLCDQVEELIRRRTNPHPAWIFWFRCTVSINVFPSLVIALPDAYCRLIQQDVQKLTVTFWSSPGFLRVQEMSYWWIFWTPREPLRVVCSSPLHQSAMIRFVLDNSFPYNLIDLHNRRCLSWRSFWNVLIGSLPFHSSSRCALVAEW